VAEAPPLLELRGITKRFGALVANREVNLRGRSGEVLGLVGENGAGKSTLMAIASGLHRPDAGAIEVAGEPCRLRGPLDAIAAGIDMVHQHFMLVDNLTVAENVILGSGGREVLNRRQLEREVGAVIERYGIALEPGQMVGDLSPTEQQRVEILTALYRDSRILILDEPTSLLDPREVEHLFGIVRQLAAEGRLVILISHKLDEVLGVCDRVSVMRNGEILTTLDSGKADAHQLAELMVGHRLQTAERPRKGTPGDEILRVSDLHVEPEVHGSGVRGFNLTVSSGEIVSVVGVAGNGQRELAEALIGLREPLQGRIELDGEEIGELTPRERFERGIACVDEDPRRTALLLQFSVSWNVGLRNYRRGGRRIGVDYPGLRELSARLIDQFDVRGAAPETQVGRLSGGNQQKLLMARELDLEPRLMVVVNPTVGVDVGAAGALHDALRRRRDAGAAILLISTDLDEAEALGDRIVVIYRGQVAAVLSGEPDRRQVGALMGGLDTTSGEGSLAGVS
jgi:ABC-type uncharacterized transport system ATPase subunit